MLGTDKNNVEEHNTPQQDDGVSCGLYVVAITEFLIKRYQNSAVMTWEINNKEAEEIKKNVLIFKKMLVDDKDYFNDLDLSTEITQKRKAKLERIHQMIARTKSVLNKAKMAEKELEQFAKDLKTSVNSPNDNVEKLVREEKKGGTKQIITIPIIPIILSAFYNSYFSKNYLKPNHEPKPRSKKINQGENIP